MLFRSFFLFLFVDSNVGEDDYNIFDSHNGFKHIIDEMKSVKPEYKANVLTKWIMQPLDHFDSNEKRVWSMRYFENVDFWKSGGPIYLFLGGEAPASKYLLTTGIMYELAKETGGSMYVSEHRYYGKSKPLYGNTAEEFKYLSARQALADNANLLRNIKMLHSNTSKVVVVGGSYSGNLAAWMRRLYPELVDAAIASSGPVLAKKDFFEYLEKVSENYENYGDVNCMEKIKSIFNRYEQLLADEAGIAQLKQEQNICLECDMSVLENKQVFFMSKTSYYMSRSQYGTSEGIASHCRNLTGASSSGDSRLWSARQNCYDYSFENMIKEYYDDGNDWILAWTYQTCTEYGYFQTTSSDSQPFTKNVPLDLYIKICAALFGYDFNELRVDDGIAEVNKLYGGLDPKVSHVAFTNGDMDPWSTLGVLEDVSYEAPAVLIARASHCRDLFSDRPSDHEELKEARRYIKYLIKRWINAFPYKFQPVKEVSK